MLVTGVVIGGIMAGAATIAQHVIIKRQLGEIEQLKAKPEPKPKEEEMDFSYLIQGKKPNPISYNDLLKGEGE